MSTLNKKKDQHAIRLDVVHLYTKNDKIKYLIYTQFNVKLNEK